MTPQEEMKQNANNLKEEFDKKIQEAVDIAVKYYNECGIVNGMSGKYELGDSEDREGSIKGLLKKAQDNLNALWYSLQDASQKLGKINTRVNRHIDDMTDADEFNQMKLHKVDTQEEGREYQSADDIIEDKEPKLRRLTLK